MTQTRLSLNAFNATSLRRSLASLPKTLLAPLLVSGTLVASSGAAWAQSAVSADTQAAGTPIRITIGSTVLTGHLNKTVMAQTLAARLPMTATFGAHPNGGDYPTKVTHLNPPLPTQGTQLGAAPSPGDIALYVPSGNLGLYYGQLQHWDGAVVLGKFSGDPKFIEQQKGPFTVTIEVATR